MKLARAIEGGLAGASTLTLLQQAVNRVDGRSPHNYLQKDSIVRKWKKAGKKGKGSTKLLVQMAGEVLSGIAYFGLSAVGKKKNALLRGGLLGAGAGIGAAFLEQEHQTAKTNGHVVTGEEKSRRLKEQLTTIALYTAGGLLAGYAVKKMSQSKKKGRKRK